jgi:Uma2 family endonuclease
LSDRRCSFCNVDPVFSGIPASSLAAQASQESARATMYNPPSVHGKAMATSSHFDARLTYDDLARMPDDGMRHEIIDGVHYVTPSPVLRHQRLVLRLATAIANYLEVHPIGEVLAAPLDVVFTQWDVVEPDLLLVTDDQRSIVTEPNIQGAPALVVEVLSPGTKQRDLGVKKDLFDRGGVREYWIVDPNGNTVTIYRRNSDGSLGEVQSLPEETNVITTPLLPGFSLTLDKLFRP